MFWNWTCLTWFKLPFCFHTSKIFPHGHQFQGNYSLTVHGMNQLELMANSRASQRFTRNFNEDPSLRELSTGSFDAVPPRQWSCGAWWFGGSVRRRIHGGTSSPCKTKIFFLKSWMVGRWKSMSEIPKWSRLFRGHLHFRGSILHWFWKWLRLFVSCPGSSMKFQWSWGHGRWEKNSSETSHPKHAAFLCTKPCPGSYDCFDSIHATTSGHLAGSFSGFETWWYSHRQLFQSHVLHQSHWSVARTAKYEGLGESGT